MASWDDVRRRLEHEVAGLERDGFVVVGEPAAPAGPPRGLLRRRHQPPSRYVQVRADGDGMLYAECVGATLFGGDWEVTPAQDDLLRSRGWYVPGQDNPWQVEQAYPNYFRYADVAATADLARACVDALAVLGVDPAGLVWRDGQ
ncbi:MAG TPA: hypothetical protein VFY76_08980 [Nocardioides sp.]|nr:hypothetical protein [Nocardioides sp.]